MRSFSLPGFLRFPLMGTAWSSPRWEIPHGTVVLEAGKASSMCAPAHGFLLGFLLPCMFPPLLSPLTTSPAPALCLGKLQLPTSSSFFRKVKSPEFSCCYPTKQIMEGEAFPSSFHPRSVYLQSNRPELGWEPIYICHTGGIVWDLFILCDSGHRGL